MVSPTPIQEIQTPYPVTLLIKRDDLIHPAIMGNKWRKLKYNLKKAKEGGFETLLTFGGAYSNHIAATAAAAQEFGFQSIGIIRGEELNANSNPTLQLASDTGMSLRFVSREKFRDLRQDWIQVKNEHPGCYILPEGGTNELAILGVEELMKEIDQKYDYIISALGTGGTLAGILKGTPADKMVIGISSLKGTFVHKDFERLLHQFQVKKTNWEILDQYHFGGYGKTTDALLDFIKQFYQTHQIPLDPIYTGKMMFAIFDLLKSGFFPKGSKIMAVHTGGLQGIAGFNQKRGKNIL